MRDNPYKDLPPLERRPDGSLYRMTPAQRKQAASLIRRECCCCEDGNCRSKRPVPHPETYPRNDGRVVAAYARRYYL